MSSNPGRLSILRDAFAGRLVPQNRDDEPAAELLARIAFEREAREPTERTPRRRRVRRTG